LLESRKKKLKLGKTEADAYLLNHLASLYMEMGKTEEAGKYLEKAIAIYAKKLGENNPTYASALRNQVQYFRYQGELDKAWELSKKVVEIRKNTLGTQHPEYLDTRKTKYSFCGIKAMLTKLR
jgi:tetratricopeptide (TPR) repeat protein